MGVLGAPAPGPASSRPYHFSTASTPAPAAQQDTTAPRRLQARRSCRRCRRAIEALSALIKPGGQGPRVRSNSPSAWSSRSTDGRNLGLYTYKDGKWERLASATLVNNGAAAKGQVDAIPANIAVLRRTSSAVQRQRLAAVRAPRPDPAALDVLTTLNPVDYTPAATARSSATAKSLPKRERQRSCPRCAPRRPARDRCREHDPRRRRRCARPTSTRWSRSRCQPGNAGIDIDYPAREAGAQGRLHRLRHRAGGPAAPGEPPAEHHAADAGQGRRQLGHRRLRLGGARADGRCRQAGAGSSTLGIYYKRMEEVLAYPQAQGRPARRWRWSFAAEQGEGHDGMRRDDACATA